MNFRLPARLALSFIGLTSFMGLSGVWMPAAAAPPPPPREIAAVPVVMLVDLGSRQTLIARQPDLSFVPASVAKVMTAYVAFQEMARGRLSPERVFVVPDKVAGTWSGKGTSLYLRAGDRLTADQLLHGIATVSANDAAIVLAEGHGGSTERWAALMNAEARRLGMAHSHFHTPNGWPDGGRTYVSAADLIRLADAMLAAHPARYRRYFGQKRMAWGGRTQESHDPITGVVVGADGIKTGFTREAGYNFLGSAQRGERRLVMVIAGARSEDQRAAASRALIEWGFAAWRQRALFDAGAVVASARVQQGAARHVPLKAGRAIYAVVPAQGGAAVSARLVYRGPLVAPLRKGAHVADLVIHVPGTLPGRIPLYAARGIDRAGPFDRLVNGLMKLLS